MIGVSMINIGTGGVGVTVVFLGISRYVCA